MKQLVFFGALALATLASTVFAGRIPAVVPGTIYLALGLGVYAARLGHAGPYPFPEGMDLIVSTLCLAAGALLVGPSLRGRGAARFARRALIGLTPLLAFAGIASIAHEAEEVIVLRTPDRSGDVLETRLWVVDYAGAPWVVTGQRSEHVRRMTAVPRVEMLRGGTATCRLAEVHTDRATLETILRLRHEKYAVQRAAVALGIWPDSPEGLEKVAAAVRLAHCPE